MTHSLVTAYGLQNHIEVLTPRPASFREMAKFHCDDYLDFLRRVTPEDSEEILKYQARFNVGEYCPDCPVFEGVYEFCSISAGGSIVAAKRINQGVADIAINWGGGLHHAKRSEASGFCYVNDIVLAIVELLKYYQRVLYIDTDVHHGDGVEEAFYSTDRVMCLSLHKFGEFFPGTGALNDIGMGKGRHYSVNVPLNDGIDDESYKFIFNSVVEHIMNWYCPGVVVLQLGADSLVGDRLGAFNLSMRGHAQSVSFLKKFNVPFLMVGGGGYTIKNVARAWCYETSVAAGVDLPEDLPYHEYFEYYHPNYLLDVTASNMENLNTREYLEKIRMVVVENLRHVAHAPSVEHHPVPVDYWSSSEEEDDAALDCYDADDICMRCSNESSDSESNYCLAQQKNTKDPTPRNDEEHISAAKHKTPQDTQNKRVDPLLPTYKDKLPPTRRQNHCYRTIKNSPFQKCEAPVQISPESSPHSDTDARMQKEKRTEVIDGICIKNLTKSPPLPGMQPSPAGSKSKPAPHQKDQIYMQARTWTQSPKKRSAASDISTDSSLQHSPLSRAQLLEGVPSAGNVHSFEHRNKAHPESPMQVKIASDDSPEFQSGQPSPETSSSAPPPK